ncbi:MAG: Gfo/Idh/MocA family oxidoreductase [Gemmatimonadota bacterium]
MSIRIGFAGVGGMGQCAHLRNYASLEGCQVVALAEMHASKARAVAQRYNVPKIYATIEEMVAREKLDGIVASQPFSRHGVLVPALLKAKVPIFTEKPLAASVPVGERLAAQVAASGTWHMVGYHKRSDPATMYARREIERLQASGELGRMTYVRLSMPAGDWIASGFVDLLRGDDADRPDYKSLPGDPPDPAMDEATFQAYVRFVNYYIHQVNLVRHLLGEDYALSYADPAQVLLVGRSAGGVPCAIEMSAYTTSIDWQESALVCFEKGWIRLDLPAPVACNRPGQVTLFRDPRGDAAPQTVVPQLPWVHAMRQQAMNFVAAIKGDAKPPCEAAEALLDLKLARDYIQLIGKA